jgi:hypothetical protein
VPQLLSPLQGLPGFPEALVVKPLQEQGEEAEGAEGAVEETQTDQEVDSMAKKIPLTPALLVALVAQQYTSRMDGAISTLESVTGQTLGGAVAASFMVDVASAFSPMVGAKARALKGRYGFR